MRYALIILVLLGQSVLATGQDLFHHPDFYYIPAPSPDKYYNDSLSRIERNTSSLPPIRYSLNIGTSFSTNSYFGSRLQTWIAPGVSYRVSDRLQVHAGMVVSTTTGLNKPENGSLAPVSNNSWVDFLVYAQADYQLTEDLTLSGSFVKSFDRTPDWAKFTPYENGFESYSMSLHYRVNSAIQIGAHVRFDKGYNPYNPGRPYGFGQQPWDPWF